MAKQVIHPKPPEIANMTLEEIAQRYVARFYDRKPDWHAFADAAIEGYKRAQLRYICPGASGKVDDPNVIPPRGFTLSIMYVPPGQGNAPHTHEVEEVFFVLHGHLTVILEEEDGRQLRLKLGPWDCIACPPGVIHSYLNESLEPVYLQVMLGRPQPELMGYVDPKLLQQRDAHLR